MSSGSLKFGRRPADPNRKALHLSKFINQGAVQTLEIPQTADYLSSFTSWNMLGNDSFGDCVAVTWANERRLLTSKLGAQETYPTIDQVVELYQTQNPNFDPNGSESTNGPGSSADNGMVIQQALEYLHGTGGPDGVKAVAFAKVDIKNTAEVDAAIAVFGCIWVGLLVLQENETEFGENVPWTVGDQSVVAGGHSVVGGGYIPDVKFVTWGNVATFSSEYWQGDSNTGLYPIEEAWIVIWPEHLGTKEFMACVNLEQLAQEYKALTGSPLNI